ncbi:hypothetical protein ACUXVY_16135 [Chromobacterium haemolyticum]|uniref:hypothetical protein n=1 Tax=Chromobacterium haemolyticum TaxID=394935 RepID=UPI004057A169
MATDPNPGLAAGVFFLCGGCCQLPWHAIIEVFKPVGDIVGENMGLQFKDVKGGRHSDIIKWMRAFNDRWVAVGGILNENNFPYSMDLFALIRVLLNDGGKGFPKLTAAERSNVFEKIMSYEDVIVSIEENSDLIEYLIGQGENINVWYAILYLSGRELPDFNLSASQHEQYANAKALVDKDARAKKYKAEQRDNGEVKVTIHQSAEVDHAALRIFALLGEKERQLEASSQAFDKTIDSFDGQLIEFKNQWNKDFSLIKEAYDKNMALQAPVRYWGAKRKKHQWWAIATGVVVMILMVLSVWFLSSQVKSVKQGYVVQAANAMKKKTPVPNAKTDASNAKIMASSSEADLPTVDSNGWHFDLALLLLEATLCFWLIRIGVRMLLSHIHLENDAAERVTMAQTYIALLRRGKLPEGDDLKTVLAALFRPSGDGIVKDEGIPPSMMDLLTKLKT